MSALNDKILKCYRQISVMIINGRNYAMPLTLLLIHQSGPVSILNLWTRYMFALCGA